MKKNYLYLGVTVVLAIVIALTVYFVGNWNLGDLSDKEIHNIAEDLCEVGYDGEFEEGFIKVIEDEIKYQREDDPGITSFSTIVTFGLEDYRLNVSV